MSGCKFDVGDMVEHPDSGDQFIVTAVSSDGALIWGEDHGPMRSAAYRLVMRRADTW